MKNPSKIILIFTILFILSSILFLKFIPNILYYGFTQPDIKLVERQYNPFLILEEYPKTKSNNIFYGTTLDGEEILYSNSVGKPPKTKCEIYSKNIDTGKITLITRFDFQCPQRLFLSKDKNYLFFEAYNFIIEYISQEKVPDDLYLSSIYSYNLDKNNLEVIKKGIEKEFIYKKQIGVNYKLLSPSPSENNKILILEESEYTVQKSIGGGPPMNYTYFNNTLLIYDIQTSQNTTIIQEKEWHRYCFIDDCPDHSDDLRWNYPFKYQFLLSRWSPDGKAVIFERGRIESLSEKLRILSKGETYLDEKNFSQNDQFIVYLSDLGIRRLKQGNIQESIDICGYYYNDNLQKYLSLKEPFQNIIFFPDGETYIRKDAVPSLGATTHYYYVLKKSDEPYCKPA